LNLELFTLPSNFDFLRDHHLSIEEKPFTREGVFQWYLNQ